MKNIKQLTALLFIFLFLSNCKTTPQEGETTVANTVKINDADTKEDIIVKAAHVVPTDNQYEALKNEFIAFIHFGPNTFTRSEWGNGKENPEVFNPKSVDTDQWCKAMKDAKMKMVIITVKHHDGFVLWQSRYTKHGIMSSPYMDGKGDILKDLSKSCAKYGLKLGVYLSPADLYQVENKDGLYGNLSKYTKRTIPREVEGRPFKNKTKFTFEVDDYNEYFLNQLFELLTEYGPIDEVWFDGANPKSKGGQKYYYKAWKELIHKLAPKAVIFGREDVRWCGNESGGTRDTEWNVIPYQEDPNTMNDFHDITSEDVGSREQLYKAKYLHYQQAETNTTIREGWFYRDDTNQRVRSADNVFDIYERSVGGNSTFLLNIPPNREGKFSDRDLNVLKEVGNRIEETYGTNLLKGAKGPNKVLDNDMQSSVLLDGSEKEIIIETKEPVTVNRFLIQEDIKSHSERVEKHALDVWTDKGWAEVAKATNIGYKRILRFPEVTTTKFRLRILESRLNPAISNISAHYYKSYPPELSIKRDIDGNVTIEPKAEMFRWKHIKSSLPFYKKLKIRYTTDGTTPTKESKIYEGNFKLNFGEVKAIAEINSMVGSTANAIFGPTKNNWKLISADSEISKHKASNALDADENTYWESKPNNSGKHSIAIDLGSKYNLKGFSYTPQKENRNGMIESGSIEVSNNGKNWTKVKDFKFGNLINDPSTRELYFDKSVTTRFIRIKSSYIAGEGKTATIAELDFFL